MSYITWIVLGISYITYLLVFAPGNHPLTMQSLKLQGRILTSTDGEDFEKALQRNSALSVLPAKYVVQPAAYSDIPPVLAFATSQIPPLEIAVKCGGIHTSTWSSTNGGAVIDMSSLHAVTVSEDKQSVTVQGGAVWGNVYEECKKAGVDVVGSPLWFVGVSGFLLGGGYGPLSGEHGLAVDNIISAKVILADGRIVETSATEEPDLFWAIRGGGGQFGILAEVRLKAFPSAAPITTGVIVYPGTEITNVLKIIKDWNTNVQTGKDKIGLTFTRSGPQSQPSILLLPWVSEDHNGSRSATVLAPFKEGAVKPVFEKCHASPDMLAVSHGADASFASAPKRFSMRGAFVADFYEELILEVWERWVKFTENPDVKSSGVIWDLTKSDKICEVKSTDTAMPIREKNYWVGVQGRTNSPDADAAIKEFITSTIQFIRKKNTALSGKDYGFWMNMSEGDEKPEDVYGPNLARLREVKTKYDPKNVFSKGVPILPVS